MSPWPYLSFRRSHSAHPAATAATINACVDKNSGQARILSPYSNSTSCGKNENPVSWNSGGRRPRRSNRRDRSDGSNR